MGGAIPRQDYNGSGESASKLRGGPHGRGTAFHNGLIEELTKTNSSEENGVVERANQEVLRHPVRLVSPWQVVLRAITDDAEDNEHCGENIHRGDTSSTYFKQFNTSIKSNSTIAEGNVPSRHDTNRRTNSSLRPHGRVDLETDRPNHGSARQAVTD